MFCRTSRSAKRATRRVWKTGARWSPWNTASAAVWLMSAAVAGDRETCAAVRAPGRRSGRHRPSGHGLTVGGQRLQGPALVAWRAGCLPFGNAEARRDGGHGRRTIAGQQGHAVAAILEPLHSVCRSVLAEVILEAETDRRCRLPRAEPKLRRGVLCRRPPIRTRPGCRGGSPVTVRSARSGRAPGPPRRPAGPVRRAAPAPGPWPGDGGWRAPG